PIHAPRLPHKQRLLTIAIPLRCVADSQAVPMIFRQTSGLALATLVSLISISRHVPLAVVFPACEASSISLA
ncbi:MAG: hypothetical protein ACKO2P_10810, partial [Planctomycetota bacterium]